MKTLTPLGISKQLVRLRESLDYATFLEDGKARRVPIFKAEVEGNRIRIYVYLDTTVTGTIRDISLVDRDGDVIAVAKREFTKPRTKGIYSVFSYTFVEVEDPDAPVREGGEEA